MTLSLILLSGLPGTGKTRLALELSRRLGLPCFAKDRFQSRLRALGLAGRQGAEGYELLFDLADQQLAAGVGAIVDAVFPMRGFRRRAEELAKTHGALFKPIYCTCSDMELWKQRLQARQQYVPDWTPVGWAEVERLIPVFEPWAPGTVLRLDALEGFEANLGLALEWVGHV